jgi:hypothetical protein
MSHKCPYYSEMGKTCKPLGTRPSDSLIKQCCLSSEEWRKCLNYKAITKK